MSFLSRLFGRKRDKGSSPGEVYSGLRAMALGLTADVVGADPSPDAVYGVVTDLGLGGGCVTLVSLIDGTTSMYTDSGGGVIGAGEHEQPAAASKALVAAAQRQLALFSRDWTDQPLRDGEVRHIALTPSGTVAAVGIANRLAAGGEPLSPVFLAANDVITAIRLTSAPYPDAQ